MNDSYIFSLITTLSILSFILMIGIISTFLAKRREMKKLIKKKLSKISDIDSTENYVLQNPSSLIKAELIYAEEIRNFILKQNDNKIVDSQRLDLLNRFVCLITNLIEEKITESKDIGPLFYHSYYGNVYKARRIGDSITLYSDVSREIMNGFYYKPTDDGLYQKKI